MELPWIYSAGITDFAVVVHPPKKNPNFFEPECSVHNLQDSTWAETWLGPSLACHRWGQRSLPCKSLWVVVNKFSLWLSCLPVVQVSLVIVIPPLLYTHSFICHWCDVTLAIDTNVKSQSLKNRYSYSTWKSLKCVHSLIRKYLNWCLSPGTLHYTVVDGTLWVSLDNSACPQSLRSPCSHSVWCCHSKETAMLMLVSCSTFLTSEYRMACSLSNVAQNLK
jgi:hypothetical protein